MLVGSHLAMSKQIAIPAISTPTPIPTSYKKILASVIHAGNFSFKTLHAIPQLLLSLAHAGHFPLQHDHFLAKALQIVLCISLSYHPSAPTLIPHTPC